MGPHPGDRGPPVNQRHGSRRRLGCERWRRRSRRSSVRERRQGARPQRQRRSGNAAGGGGSGQPASGAARGAFSGRGGRGAAGSTLGRLFRRQRQPTGSAHATSSMAAVDATASRLMPLPARMPSPTLDLRIFAISMMSLPAPTASGTMAGCRAATEPPTHHRDQDFVFICL